MYNNLSVKRLLLGTIRLNRCNIYSSETEDKVRFCKKQNKCGTQYKFYNWLVGFTDVNGYFNVYRNKEINLSFKISEKKNNLRVLYYIKKNLKVGKVKVDKSGMGHFLIRNKDDIKNVIIPIFNRYKLKSCKINS